MKEIENKFIAVDFDGTCVTHRYPDIGGDIGAVPVLKRLAENGAKLILWTMRSGEELNEAVNWFNSHNIPLYCVNMNVSQREWTTSPKAYAHYYIDDAAVGAPLTIPENEERPYINWGLVERYFFGN